TRTRMSRNTVLSPELTRYTRPDFSATKIASSPLVGWVSATGRVHVAPAKSGSVLKEGNGESAQPRPASPGPASLGPASNGPASVGAARESSPPSSALGSVAQAVTRHKQAAHHEAGLKRTCPRHR